MHKDKYIFYITLLKELVFFPFIYLFHWVKVLSCCSEQTTKQRVDVENKKVKVVVHEWGGYPMIRKKRIKNGATFECGLKGQIERFADTTKFDLTITMSEEHLFDINILRDTKIIAMFVDNCGMDFSGYSTFYEKIKDEPNSYVILTNSSVNNIQCDFIDGYIEYMERNRDVGMLGVSYCTKMIQTFIRKNFTPHLQSFFLLTTTDVLKKVVEKNSGKFPGRGVNHKLLLIRNGEIKISKLVKNMGYNLAVVNPADGKVTKFNCYKNWSLPFGDIRQKIDTPNIIRKIEE